MSRSTLSSRRARGRPEAKGMYLGIVAFIVLLLSLPLVACGNNPAAAQQPPTATTTQPPTSTATATAQQPPTATTTQPPTSTATVATQQPPTATATKRPTPTKVVDNFDPKNFYTSRNPDLTLEVFGTLSTDRSKMHIVVEGNVSTPWHITSIDPTLSANPSSGVAQPGNNDILLTASNSQANLVPGSSYDVPISFYPVNPNPDEPKPATVQLTVHSLPTFSTLTAPVPVPEGTTITITGDGSFTDLDMIAGISFGSANASFSLINGVITLTVPPAENPGTVPITITVKRHDGSSMSFTLPDQFTYTSTAAPTTQLPTHTQRPTPSTANIHTTRGKIAIAVI